MAERGRTACSISFISLEVVLGVKASKRLWNDMERKNCDF